jgi:GxxExxY protein
MTENEVSGIVIGAAIDIHKYLGPGLLESAYDDCLAYKLRKIGLKVEAQKPIPLIYEEVHLQCGYRCDILVEEKVLIEVKAVEALNEIHMAQVLTYLKLTNIKLGLLINFNVARLKDGIKRVVCNL